MLNVFDIAIPEERPDILDRVAYAVEPDRMYPASLSDMVESLPHMGELDSAMVSILAPVAGILTPANIALVGLTKPETVAQHGAEALAIRAALMTGARLWFTERLHVAINHAPLNFRILRDERYRL